MILHVKERPAIPGTLMLLNSLSSEPTEPSALHLSYREGNQGSEGIWRVPEYYTGFAPEYAIGLL